MRRTSGFPWQIPLLGIVSAASLCAQSTGTTTADLRGRLRWTEASSPAEVRIRSKARGTLWTVPSTPLGDFAFQLLPPGDYELEVWSAGCMRLHVASLQLHAGMSHEIGLSIPAQSQVSVEGALESAGDGRTQTAWVVDSQLLTHLPINRRDFADLSLVTPMAAPGRGPINPGAPDSGLSFAGAGPRHNNFMVDGLDNNDLGNGNSRLLVSQEAIQEFQVIASGYAAEFGRATGGVVNAVTRSGSNEPEGSLFYFLRPGGLDANPPRAASATHFRMQQYGGSVSGPILKDRLFYYICAERLDRSDENRVTMDPTVVAAIRNAGFQVQTDPQRAKEAAFSVLVKLDYLKNPENRWGLRLLQSRRENDAQIPWGGLRARSVGGDQDTRDLALTLTHQWIPSSSLIRETRAMYTTRANDLKSLDEARTVQVEIQGAASFGTQRLTPQSNQNTYLQLADTTTWIQGSHTFKGGLDWLHTRNWGIAADNHSGYYLFQALPPLGLATSLTAFQANAPVAFLQAFGDPSTRFSTDYQSAFLQDEWRPRPDLLLRFGLRYDREALPTFVDTPDYQALGSPSASRLSDGSVAYSSLFRTQRNWTSARWSPRFSLDWQAAPTWRLFGGFGTFMGQTNLSPIFGMRTTNGLQGYGILRTVMDANPYGPYLSWMNLDGGIDHRYASAPLTDAHVLVIPGTHQAPVSRQGNLGLEWKPSHALTLTLDVLRTEGSHLLNVRDVNAFVPAGSAPRRVDQGFSAVYRVDDSGASRYSGQSLTVDWSPSPEARFLVSYCHSRAEDNYSDWTGILAPQNTFDPSTEWGPSFQDQRHRFRLSAVLGTGTSRAPWLRDWTFALQASLGSGRPYSQLAGVDLNMNGDGASDRPAGVGRNSENLPWSRRVDMRIKRSFKLAKTRVEGTMDVFNLFNHANVTEVQNTLTSNTPAYGTATEFEPMRQFQFGVRLRY